MFWCESNGSGFFISWMIVNFNLSKQYMSRTEWFNDMAKLMSLSKPLLFHVRTFQSHDCGNVTFVNNFHDLFSVCFLVFLSRKGIFSYYQWNSLEQQMTVSFKCKIYPRRELAIIDSKDHSFIGVIFCLWFLGVGWPDSRPRASPHGTTVAFPVFT